MINCGVQDERDLGVCFDSMLEDLGKESGEAINQIMKLVSSMYGISVKKIKECLGLVESKFVCPVNCVVGYIDGKEIKRTALFNSYKNIMEKFCYKYKRVMEYDESDVIEDLEIKRINKTIKDFMEI